MRGRRFGTGLSLGWYNKPEGGNTMVYSLKSSVWVNVNHALLIEEEDFRFLHSNLAETFSDGIAYRAQCLDGTELRFDEVEELISFENPNFRRIVGITIHCICNSRIELHLEVGARDSFFDTPFDRTNAKYHIVSSDDRELTRLRAELNRRMISMRPWYWILSLAKTHWVLGSIGFLYGLVLGSYSLVDKWFLGGDVVLRWLLAGF